MAAIAISLHFQDDRSLAGAHPGERGLGGTAFEEELAEALRGPRAAAGVVAGCSLGAATVLLQSLTRNPLGEPATLGLSAGGMLTVTLGAAYGGVGIPAVIASARRAVSGLTQAE